MADVTFITQAAPVDEYGRALYAVARSIVRAIIDQLSNEDLADLNCERADVTWRQLCKLARLDRDKGMRGDGFEWAVHEAIVGKEPSVLEPISDVLSKVSRYIQVDSINSVMFGHERAKFLGFLDAVVTKAGEDAVILPDGRGHPYDFGPWVALAAEGQRAEDRLTDRIKQIWKTDIFIGDRTQSRYVAATIKSNHHLLEEGRGLRIGIVPEAKDLKAGISKRQSLWTVTLPDRYGFMDLFNDAYAAVAEAVCTVGKHVRGPYYLKPTSRAQKLQEQLEKYPTARAVDIEGALNQAAQQDLVGVTHKLISVEAPAWLKIAEKTIPIIAPKPIFAKID